MYRISTYSVKTHRGKNYLQITSNDDNEFDCPFCGESHSHGRADGHRIAHCRTGRFNEAVEMNGEVFYQKDGFFIKYVESEGKK